MKQRNQTLQKTLLYLALIIGVLITIIPFYWMIIGATNKSGDVFNIPPTFLPGSNLLDNLTNLNESILIWKSLFNSLFIAITYTLIGMLLCASAGYAFAKFDFKGRNVIFIVLLLSMMIPYQATIIPLFQLFAKLDWMNTYSAVILPQLVYVFPIFLMRQNMKALPDSLLEAARIDSAGEFYIFFRIALPTMKPALAAVAIFLFNHQWNNFMWPLVVMNTKDMFTLPVALSTLAGQDSIDYGQAMLGTTISVLPVIVIFLFMQKHFVSGILGGAVKG
ncbi:carbohydrate ABC transporter permease [Paenibacillus oenotherae]|nr:carbohydrate ABC transporter permease [Paenibacillus oenotherae]